MFKSNVLVTTDERSNRSALTAIYFLLPAGAVNRWHRVRSDEVWHHYEGAALELLMLSADQQCLERFRLGPSSHQDQAPVCCVPADRWQAARSTGSYTLVGCTVGPGFEFAAFELLANRESLARQVVARLPDAGLYV